mmetsp:Transcript_37104/g.98862  ORF Transcript_37104/g.98862 Transcript_37104/m.98862 type:complete len:282 (-) Transcript_37104:190-1035(-)
MTQLAGVLRPLQPISWRQLFNDTVSARIFCQRLSRACNSLLISTATMSCKGLGEPDQVVALVPEQLNLVVVCGNEFPIARSVPAREEHGGAGTSLHNTNSDAWCWTSSLSPALGSMWTDCGARLPVTSGAGALTVPASLGAEWNSAAAHKWRNCVIRGLEIDALLPWRSLPPLAPGESGGTAGTTWQLSSKFPLDSPAEAAADPGSDSVDKYQLCKASSGSVWHVEGVSASSPDLHSSSAFLLNFAPTVVTEERTSCIAAVTDSSSLERSARSLAISSRKA